MDNRDIALIFDQVSKDDREAFNKLFYAYFERLVSYAAIYAGNISDAEDIVSTFFVQLWYKRHSLAKIKSPVSYLYVAVKNRSLNHLRASSRKVLESVPESESGHFTTGLGDMEERELKLVLTGAIKALPEQRKVIFILVKVNGHKSIDVAGALGISVRTVENQLYKAIKQLAESLSAYLGFDPRKRTHRESLKSLHLFF